MLRQVPNEQHLVAALVVDQLVHQVAGHEDAETKQMQGSISRNAVPQVGALKRAHYMKRLSWYAMR